MPGPWRRFNRGRPGGRLLQLLIPDYRSENPMPILLAALLACLMLTTTAAAQETPEADDDDRTAILFHIGTTALAEAEQADSDDARRELYDKAIAAFRLILVNHPQLIRVRLELARTFFLKGQDGLARRHFEAVLAGGVPPPVAANIHAFLNVMQARKRWTGYFGGAIAPDSNLNAAFGKRDHLHRHGVRAAALPARGGFRRPIGFRRLGVGRRRVPAAAERAAAPAGRCRPGGAGVSAQRLRPDLPGRPCRAALAGEPNYRNQPAGHCAAPMAGQHTPTWTRPACAWNSTAG